ncbi:TIGR03619 family F420-dependent LLM class oxidoreductase [Nocardia jiangxiensis]|uniref:TIGR03619 family F420-dependent LLM class oxidoreductase n=1 Tax=Nocardia jiangxiensis TaxID=282685 RepID=A0ABW6RXL6_9NOCA|nr:TIGR03619 family F420-dependent LLM class oxidoreductase [Nocardia jiangxiensis]
MPIGFAIPQLGPQAREGREVPRFAREVERAGAHSLWVGDRLLAATRPKVGYRGGTTIPAEFDAVLDPFAVLTAAAAVTERVRLGTNVLVAPLYRPVPLARALTTIDVISGGRLVAGLGIGWSPEEYEAAGVPFDHRGARLQETIEALRTIWTSDPAEYRGRYVTVPEHRSSLDPVQRPHPPIHLAAFAPAGIARVGRYADGWLPALRVPGNADQARFLRRMRQDVDAAAESAGRDPSDIETIIRVNVEHGATEAQIAETIESTAADTGFEDYFIDLMYLVESVDQVLDTAQRLLRRLG